MDERTLVVVVEYNACQEMDVRFCLEDYAPFATGSAYGAYEEEKYKDLNNCLLMNIILKSVDQ